MYLSYKLNNLCQNEAPLTRKYHYTIKKVELRNITEPYGRWRGPVYKFDTLELAGLNSLA